MQVPWLVQSPTPGWTRKCHIKFLYVPALQLKWFPMMPALMELILKWKTTKNKSLQDHHNTLQNYNTQQKIQHRYTLKISHSQDHTQTQHHNHTQFQPFQDHHIQSQHSKCPQLQSLQDHYHKHNQNASRARKYHTNPPKPHLTPKYVTPSPTNDLTPDSSKPNHLTLNLNPFQDLLLQQIFA